MDSRLRGNDKEKEKTWARCPCDTWTGRPCYEKEWIPACAGMTKKKRKRMDSRLHENDTGDGNNAEYVVRLLRLGEHCILSGGTENERLIMNRQLTAIIEREDDGYVALCPEVDVASQGDTVDEARDNLKEALELFFETASAEEVKSRLHNEVYVTHMEVAVG